MAKIADFSYDIIDHSGRKCIVIIDRDNGGVSVTNSIENVVAAIKAAKNIDNISDYIIVYRDSMGIWDGWDDANQDFVSLQQANYELAIKKYIESCQK